jgi:hypothetical protein
VTGKTFRSDCSPQLRVESICRRKCCGLLSARPPRFIGALEQTCSNLPQPVFCSTQRAMNARGILDRAYCSINFTRLNVVADRITPELMFLYRCGINYVLSSSICLCSPRTKMCKNKCLAVRNSVSIRNNAARVLLDDKAKFCRPGVCFLFSTTRACEIDKIFRRVRVPHRRKILFESQLHKSAGDEIFVINIKWFVSLTVFEPIWISQETMKSQFEPIICSPKYKIFWLNLLKLFELLSVSPVRGLNQSISRLGDDEFINDWWANLTFYAHE